MGSVTLVNLERIFVDGGKLNMLNLVYLRLLA